MKAVEEIWNEYHLKLAAFIRGKVSEDVVDDLLQDVFVKIHGRIDSLKEDVKLESWLFQVTRNTIIDYYRSRRMMEELPVWVEEPQPEEEAVIRGKLSSCLEPMIQELPDMYRRAVQLSEVENKSQREVAEREGVSLSGAKSRIQRGRALLKVMLYECCEFELNRGNQVVSYKKRKGGCSSC